MVAVIVIGKWRERGRAESPESPNCGRGPRGRGEWRLGRAIPNAAILLHHVNRSYIFCGLKDSWLSDGDGGVQQAVVPCVRDAKCGDQVGVGFFFVHALGVTLPMMMVVDGREGFALSQARF